VRHRVILPSVRDRDMLGCTAGKHSMQRVIRMALITAIRDLALYYYISPQAAMSQALELDSDPDIFNRTRKGPNRERGSKVL
jgi:hypothetical protein